MLCVAVAECGTRATSVSRRQCNDFTAIALLSPEKYCPCIRSSSGSGRGYSLYFNYLHFSCSHIDIYVKKLKAPFIRPYYTCEQSSCLNCCTNARTKPYMGYINNERTCRICQLGKYCLQFLLRTPRNTN